MENPVHRCDTWLVGSGFRNRLGVWMSIVLPALMLVSITPASASQKISPEWEIWGHSVKDRPIVVRRSGDTSSPFKVLVVGSIHGDEPEGMKVVDRLNRRFHKGINGVDLWTIRTVNPDGIKRGTRKNAHGVDLNRNFPFRFDPGLTNGYESGPGPSSEPETRTVERIARRGDFDLAIWYHQPWGETLVPCNSAGPAARRYSQLSGLARDHECDGYVPGSAIGWMHHRFGTKAFVVELDGYGKVKHTQIKRHARAVVLLAKEERPEQG